MAGNVVNDTRKPYQQGMVFRCDPDGSNVETLGWNFRNNWEVCVDSFGTMWQSDNDDDGNRGVRINYVMEYGDYGYRDQRTGATWQTPRIGMRQEIGERHWHLNDPGVGGHRMGDSERGRLFRITTDQVRGYEFPAADFGTFAGAAQALASPNQSTRYLAGEAIQRFWSASPAKIDDYLTVERIPSPRMRARWLWQLTRQPKTRQAAIIKGLNDPDSNVRIAAIRAARQHAELDKIQIIKQRIDDPSPQVRRELAISLRGIQDEEAARLWTQLALAYDGKDRWYLESLGIGAEGQWDRFFTAWIAQVGDDWKKPGNRDVIWRARTPAACEYLARLIRDTQSIEEQQRYFRALDLQEGDQQQSALLSLVSQD